MCATTSTTCSRATCAEGHERAHAHGLGCPGLPAENAALKTACHQIVDARKHRLHEETDAGHGLAIDWSRRSGHLRPYLLSGTSGCSLKMLERGIATARPDRQLGSVDQTVLANERVIDGKGWRTGAPVEKRRNPRLLPEHHRLRPGLLDHVQIGNDKSHAQRLARQVRLLGELDRQRAKACAFFTHSLAGADGAADR